MSLPYTRRLAGHVGESPGSRVLYTVPADVTVIVRDIVVGNKSDAPGHIHVWAYSDVDGYWYFLSLPELAPQTSAHLSLRQGMNPGELIQVETSIGLYWTVGVTGYVFQA